MVEPPVDIQARRTDREMVIVWPDDRVDHLPFRELRGNCPCAVCVSEDTGIRQIGPDQVTPDVTPMKMELSGNYALKIWWSDGHSTGLYSWKLLRHLGDERVVRESKQ